MAVDVVTALGLVGLGGVLGAAGQGARVVIGLKKDLQAAAQDDRLKELVAREEELHAKIRDLTDMDRQLEAKEKEGRPPTENAPTSTFSLSSEREALGRVKERLLKEKEMVLNQRRLLAWFHPSELLVSLLIAFIIGAIAGVLAGVQMLEGEFEEITQSTMFSIILAGYAGTDFIEGFITQKLPK